MLTLGFAVGMLVCPPRGVNGLDCPGLTAVRRGEDFGTRLAVADGGGIRGLLAAASPDDPFPHRRVVDEQLWLLPPFLEARCSSLLATAAGLLGHSSTLPGSG